MGLIRKGHIKLKNTGISIKLFKIKLCIFLVCFFGCDFRLPQDWETPSWELPLSIPLFNDSITMYDLIDTTGSDLSLDTLNNYSIDTSLVMIYEPCPDDEESGYDPNDICCVQSLPGYNPFDENCPVRVSITDEYFSADGVSLEIEIEPIEINISTDQIDPISETIEVVLSDLVGEDISSGCIPLDLFESTSETISLDPVSLAPYDQFSALQVEYLDSINSIIVDDGYIAITLENNLPFTINNFQLEFLDQDGEVWVNNQVENVSSGNSDSDQVDLVDSVVPRSISATPVITYSLADSDCYLYLPLSEIEEDLEFTEEQCFALELSGVVDNQCSLDIDNDVECSILNDEVDDYELVWTDGECQIDVGEGINITGSENLEVSYSFSINGGRVDAKITMVQEISGTETLPIDFEGIDFISAHLKDVGDEDKNKLQLEFVNNLFTEIDLRIQFDNFFDEELNSLEIQIPNPPTPNTQVFEFDFADHFIGNPEAETPLESIGYVVVSSLVEESVVIAMNEPYSFSVSGAEIKPFEFDELIVDFEEFESPPIEMGDIPAGFSGFELPTLGFDLIFYNTINSSLKLELDITGTSDDEGATPIVIHVEPIIEYKGNDVDSLDVTILSILNNELVVTQSDGTVATYLYGQNDSGQELSIYDVFSQDNITVTGDAKLTGRSKLEPGRSVWANMDVVIDPLSIIITDNMSFISEIPITLEPIDASTSSKIDSGIVSATVDLEIENAIPLNGTIDMIISNSQYFPPCLDTLVAGSMSDQLPLISTGCAEYLYSKHSTSTGETTGPNQITVQSKGDYNFYYIEFIDAASDDTTFFGKFLNMSLILPDDINDDGIVLTSSQHTEVLDLLSDEVKWLTNDNTLYIAPQVVLLSYDEDDPDDNGWRTIQSSSYLNVNSLLTLVLDMGEIIETTDLQEKIK